MGGESGRERERERYHEVLPFFSGGEGKGIARSQWRGSGWLGVLRSVVGQRQESTVGTDKRRRLG